MENAENISTHSPRVGRTLRRERTSTPCEQFQLTRPVWGEPAFSSVSISILRFQLTRPVWGEPDQTYLTSHDRYISTHSPRVGRTLKNNENITSTFNFNSLAPCGANPLVPNMPIISRLFQLTRPVWGEPARPLIDVLRTYISTHSPRVGRTLARRDLVR